MIDATAMRQRSLAKAAALGFPINPSLPLLEEIELRRTKDQVVDRILGILCVGAVAYGFERGRAVSWLERESREWLLTPAETAFMQGDSVDRIFKEQIEGGWALSWAVGLVEGLDFFAPCSSDFVRLLPDVKNDEPAESFRAQVRLRPIEAIAGTLDLSYCLHWAIVDGELHSRGMQRLPPYVVIERRRALEWLTTDTPWEQITLDT